jgi:hypothetical protein
MPQSKSTPRAGKPAGPPFPKLSVAKVEQAGVLLEHIVDENVDLFVRKGQEYRDKHREGTARHLTPVELGQLAAAMGRTLTEVKEDVDDAGIRYWDEPDRNEVLVAAGVATAPAFVQAAMRFVALIEMPDDVFARAYMAETLDDAIMEAADAARFEDVKTMRARAGRAMDYFADGVADRSGKGLALIAQTVIQGLGQAMSHLEPSESSSLTDSAASTGGSPTSTSSSDSTTVAQSA